MIKPHANATDRPSPTFNSWRACRAITAGALTLAVSAHSWAQERPWETLEGLAKDPQSGQVIYQERHSMAQNAEGDWVMESDYLAPDGALFAERTVSFDPSYPQRPDYRLTDYRDDFEEGATTLDDGRVELFRVIDGERKSETIRPADDRPLVIDAGFSAFIASHWSELLAGQRLTFDFASSARLTTIPFRLSHVDTIDREGTGRQQKFKLEPSNWFVRMLVNPIVLTYADDTRALIGYDGLSNIRKDGGGNHTVEIQFPPDHQFSMRQLPSGSRQAVP